MRRCTLHRLLTTFVLGGVLLATGSAIASPEMMHYQGYLRDDSGAPVTEPVDLDFAIYDAATDGAVLWSETHLGVTPTDGVFSVVLGSESALTPDLFDGQERWVETSVEGEPLVPRRQFLSAPYALHAAVAEIALAGGESDADWTIDGDDIYRLSGLVGVGTDAPEARFHADGGPGAGPFAVISGGGGVFENVTLRLHDRGPAANNRNVLEFAHTDDSGGPHVPVPGARLTSWSVGNDAASGVRLNIETASDNQGTFNSNQLVLHQTGNVGIGTSSPLTKLHIVGGTPTGAQNPHPDHDHLVVDDESYAYINLRSPSDAYAGILFSDDNRAAGFIQYRHPDDSMAFYTAPGGGARLTIDGTGNVGIGTDNPTSKLTVAGDAAITGDASVSGGKLEVVAFSGTPELHLSDGFDSNAVISQDIVGNMRFATGPLGNEAARFYVTTGGVFVVGTTTTDVLQITGGADLAEPFRVEAKEEIEPGMVLSIDPKRPGELRLADRAYDRCVAGIASGAKGVRAGITLQQEGTLAAGSVPVALSGRVYCLVDASYGSVQPGDLLTTSDTPGYAMRVSDHDAAQGAVIGKAMTALEAGRGHVLVLVKG